MLPDIMEIADKYGIVFNSRTLKQKEVRYKCPFCMEDSNKHGKYYLSLNVQDKVYKCWNCKIAGGVLDFESRLSGISYAEIKAKYNKNGKLTTAEMLNTQQLAALGIHSKDEAKRVADLKTRWEQYEHNILSELLAELLCITYLHDPRREQLLAYLAERCEKSLVRNAYERITHEWTVNDDSKSAWGKEGLVIARISWKMMQEHGQMEQVIKQIPFIHFLVHKMKDSAVQ